MHRKLQNDHQSWTQSEQKWRACIKFKPSLWRWLWPWLWLTTRSQGQSVIIVVEAKNKTLSLWRTGCAYLLVVVVAVHFAGCVSEERGQAVCHMPGQIIVSCCWTRVRMDASLVVGGPPSSTHQLHVNVVCGGRRWLLKNIFGRPPATTTILPEQQFSTRSNNVCRSVNQCRTCY